MSQLIKDLESCVRTAKLAGPEWFKYTMMEITAEHAEKILDVIKAAEYFCEVYEGGGAAFIELEKALLACKKS